jgi:hypothetical protein
MRKLRPGDSTLVDTIHYNTEPPNIQTQLYHAQTIGTILNQIYSPLKLDGL